MESSTVVAFRALVMLACLVVVPLAAVFGSAFPDLVKSLIVDRFAPAKLKSPPSAASLAPPFGYGSPVSTAAPQASGAAPVWNVSAAQAGHAATPAPGAMPPSVVRAGATAPAAPQVEVPAVYSAPAEQAPWNPANVKLARAVEPGHPQAGALEGPDPSAAPAYGPPPAAVAQSPGAEPMNPPAQQPERFTWIEKRLREYGATYYLLETWGNEGELYRFHCKMALGNNPNFTRHFEATDSDALTSMSRVLEQVESWRAGRMQ